MIAKAPYNFIPLPDKVVPAEGFASDRQNNETHDLQHRSHHKYHADCYSGYLDLTLTNETPLFIGGERTDLGQGQSIKFFRRDGQLCIPGSSYRGMLRTLVAIVSFSQISFVDRGKRLHFRNIGNKNYRAKVANIVESEGKRFTEIKARPGYLKKINGQYKIIKAESYEGEDLFRVNGSYDERNFTPDGLNDCSLAPQTQCEIWFKPSPSNLHTHRGNNLRYAKLNSGDISKTPNKEFKKGLLIVTGWMYNKHMNWVIGEPSEEELHVPIQIIKNYEEDDTRGSKIDLLEQCKNNEEVPCFYITDASGNVVSIAHTPIHRYAYDNTIGDYIPSTLSLIHI